MLLTLTIELAVAWDQHLTTEVEGPSFISRTVVLRRVDAPALLVTQYPILHYTRFIVTPKQSDPNRRIGTFGLAAGGRLCPSPRRFSLSIARAWSRFAPPTHRMSARLSAGAISPAETRGIDPITKMLSRCSRSVLCRLTSTFLRTTIPNLHW
jgi:hypothetical protein